MLHNAKDYFWVQFNKLVQLRWTSVNKPGVWTGCECTSNNVSYLPKPGVWTKSVTMVWMWTWGECTSLTGVYLLVLSEHRPGQGEGGGGVHQSQNLLVVVVRIDVHRQNGPEDLLSETKQGSSFCVLWRRTQFNQPNWPQHVYISRHVRVLEKV